MSKQEQRKSSFFFIWMIMFGVYFWMMSNQMKRAEEMRQAEANQATEEPAAATETVPNAVSADPAVLPPIVLEDLLLGDPAWARLKPAAQPSAVLQRLDSTKDFEQGTRLKLTAAYLYEQSGSPAEAAKLYAQVQGSGGRGAPQPGDPAAAHAMSRAAQAHLRSAELYLQLAAEDPASQRDNEKKARRSLDALVMQIQRDQHDLTSIVQRAAPAAAAPAAAGVAPVVWEPVADPYGYVLQQIDQITRHQMVYRLIDGLVRVCGNKPGISQILALVFLAVGLKLLMYPLSRKQYQSMAAMQRVAPEMEGLRKRYKDNPQRLNEEMMKLYREQGVNPVGGCLPMLVQFPVFIAVYQGIRAYTWHFHHAGVLWIDSLAADDTPLLLIYGLSMFGTQYLMMRRQPPPADPQQAMMQKYMTFGMPILFTWMMYSWRMPSAFYLYWMTFNVISTVEQLLTSHKRSAVVAAVGEPVEGPPPAVTRQEAAGRPKAGRKTGSGRRKRRKGSAR